MLLATLSAGAEPETIQLPEPGLAEIRLPVAGDGYHVIFEQRTASRSDSRVYELSDNTCYVQFVDLNERIEVRCQIIDWTSQSVEYHDYVLTVSSEATAPARPIGDAGDVYDLVNRVNRPDEALRLSNAIRAAVVAIKAKSNITHAEAQAEVTRWLEGAKLGKDWEPFFAVISRWLADKARNREQTLELLGVVQQGLDAATGGLEQ